MATDRKADGAMLQLTNKQKVPGLTENAYARNITASIDTMSKHGLFGKKIRIDRAGNEDERKASGAKPMVFLLP